MRQFLCIATMPLLVTGLMSCSGKKAPEDLPSSNQQKESQQVADRIIYDVVIKNHDPEDDWTEECLAGLKRQELVDFIFTGLYEERFKAFDIFSNEPIPVRKIRKMEEDGVFARDQVSKIQFVEGWYIDPSRYTMTKEVTEVRLGLEHFDGFGMQMGHNPLFKVRLALQ